MLMPKKWVFPKIGVPQNGWFIMVPNPIKMDDLGGPPLFLVQHPCIHIHCFEGLNCEANDSNDIRKIECEFCTVKVATSISSINLKMLMADEQTSHHQEFQVPKMKVLNLIRPFWGWVFPYISRIHTAYIGEYLHFRYLKCLVITCKCLWL